MRLGCFLVLLAVLASLILEPPRAKAFAVTSSAVTALAGAYLNACGLAPVVSGMSSSEEVNESLARLIQEYLDTDLPGTPLTDWLGNLRACLISSDEDGNEGESKNLSRNNKFTLTIFPKPAEFVQPAEKALYHPTTRQHNKSV